jgi:hypothetical protein
LSKIPEVRGSKGDKGDQGIQGIQGMPGKDAVVDYPTLSKNVVGDAKLQEAVRLGLVTDANFQAVIAKYFKDNAVMFRGEKGVTEFKALSVEEKAAIVTMIVQQNKDEFAKGLADNKDFRQAIIDALVVRPEMKGPQGERGLPGPIGPAGKDAVVDYAQLGTVVAGNTSFVGNVSGGLASRSEFVKAVSDSQDLRRSVVDQMATRPEFKGPQGIAGPVGPPGKDADGFVGMWFAQRYQRGGAADFIANPNNTHGVRPAIETALIGTTNLDDNCRFTGGNIWQNASSGFNAAYSTRIFVTSTFQRNLDNVKGTNPFSVFVNGRRTRGQFMFEKDSWYTIEIFHGVESSGDDSFVELGWNPKNLRQNIGTVIAVTKNGGIVPPPAPSSFDAGKLQGSAVVGQKVSLHGSLIEDGTIPFQKFSIAQGESLPVRMLPMVPDSKIAGVAAAKVTFAKKAAMDFGSGYTAPNEREKDAGKIGYQSFSADGLDIVGAGAAVGRRKVVLWDDAHVKGNLTVDRGIDGNIVRDGTVSSAKIANNAITGEKIANNAVTNAKLANNAVTGEKIADNAVTNAKLANNAVTGEKIADNAVTNAKLASGIDATKITTGTLLEARIPQLPSSKIIGGVGTSIGNDSVTTAMIKNNAVTNEKIASGIDGTKITTGTISIDRTTGNIPASRITGLPTNGIAIGDAFLRHDDDWVRILSNPIDISSYNRGFAAKNLWARDSLTVANRNILAELDVKAAADYEQFTRATDGTRSGTWSFINTTTKDWDPAFRGSRVGAIANFEEGDANATNSFVDYNVPAGMKQAYVVYLPWSNSRYFNIHGINNANQEVFVRRVDATGIRDMKHSDNFNGVTAASVAGVNRFKTLRVRGGKGRMYLMGVGWTREEGRAMETGFIHADNVIGMLTAEKIPQLPSNKIIGGVGTSMGNNSVTTAMIQDNAVTNAKLANNAVTGEKIADNAVTNAKLANNAVTGEKIADNAVTNAKLASGIDAAKITSGSLSANRIDGVSRLILDNWKPDRFSFANGISVKSGAWGRTKDGNEPSAFYGELAIQNGDGNWTHFNHRNANINFIRGDTQIDGKVTIAGRNILAELDDLRANAVRRDRNYVIRREMQGHQCVDFGGGVNGLYMNATCDTNNGWQHVRFREQGKD